MIIYMYVNVYIIF